MRTLTLPPASRIPECDAIVAVVHGEGSSGIDDVADNGTIDNEYASIDEERTRRWCCARARGTRRTQSGQRGSRICRRSRGGVATLNKAPVDGDGSGGLLASDTGLAALRIKSLFITPPSRAWIVVEVDVSYRRHRCAFNHCGERNEDLSLCLWCNDSEGETTRPQ
jgi:hypothetical protein